MHPETELHHELQRGMQTVEAKERARLEALAALGAQIVGRMDGFKGKIPVRMVREGDAVLFADAIVLSLNLSIPLADFAALGWEPAWSDPDGKLISDANVQAMLDVAGMGTQGPTGR